MKAEINPSKAEQTLDVWSLTQTQSEIFQEEAGMTPVGAQSCRCHSSLETMELRLRLPGLDGSGLAAGGSRHTALPPTDPLHPDL